MPEIDGIADMDSSPDCPQFVQVIIFSGYSMVTLGSVIEPLRIANEFAQKPIYEVSVVTATDDPVRDANNIIVAPTDPFDVHGRLPEFIILCTGQLLNPPLPTRLLNWMANAACHGSKIGAIGTGAFSLARCRLLNGYRCTTHWKFANLFREMYPEIDLTDGLFEIDRNRMTAAGGSAGMDMILRIIAQKHGKELALDISEALLHPAIRFSEVAQQVDHLLPIRQKSERLWKAIRMMEKRIEEPVQTNGIARAVGISTRQLERLFQIHLGRPPGHYYAEIRLQRARQMLRFTDLQISEISVATGFGNPSNFTSRYRRLFGCTPTSERQ